MIFIIGEDTWSRLLRYRHWGGIGLYYDSVLTGLLAYLIFGLFCLFAIIGIITVIKFIISKRTEKKKEKDEEDPHQKWLKTGKM